MQQCRNPALLTHKSAQKVLINCIHNLIGNCSRSESEFLIEHLISCRCAEMVKAKYRSIDTNNAHQCGWKSGS